MILCKKLTFSCRKGAKAFLKRHQLTNVQKSYKCPYCFYFHNTSGNSEQRKHAREIFDKQTEEQNYERRD